MTDSSISLDIILHTPKGLVLAALQIARAIKRHQGKVTVFVPYHAMSGGTLIALAADEIVMARNAVLGPVDPQLGELPAVSILKIHQLMNLYPPANPTQTLCRVSAIIQTKGIVRA